MGGRLEDLAFKKQNFAPGPGNYEIHDRQNLKHATSPKFAMGREDRNRNPHDKEQKGKPGAGSHDVMHQTYSVLKTKAPSFGFGSAKRPDIAGKGFTPGPGAYKVPTKVANVAGYSQAQGDGVFKHV